MSLTEEQKTELKRLNELLGKVDARAGETDPEELVHQFMMEEFTFVSPGREQMQKLSDMRKKILGQSRQDVSGQKATNHKEQKY